MPMKKSFTDNSVIQKLLPVVLPHELFPFLAKYGHLPKDLSTIAKYWEHACEHMVWASHEQAWANGPNETKHLRMPLYLYGDDTRFSGNEKLCVVMIGAVLDERSSSMATHFPLFVIRLETWLLSSSFSRTCTVVVYSTDSWCIHSVQPRTKALSTGFETMQAFLKPATCAKL